MPSTPPTPITCLVTPGETTRETTPESEEFRDLLALVARAVAAGVALIQLREKNLSARTLHQLAARAAALARGTETRILVNDRADIALASRCDGVQLTAQSLEARVVRRVFGERFLVGVSTHSRREAREARDGGADFAIFGPVFDTPSKRAYGLPLGLEDLREAALALAPFPLLAVGGITLENMYDVLRAGAAGLAAIRMFVESRDLVETVRALENLSTLGDTPAG
ncbi:MAG: thiamine phosphate synthase [Acidobacteria bacterium]|nr:thiamine phosphate synthase [Acidobacteriota bacterium]